MIYEFRTYCIQPRTLPEFLKRFDDALEKRLQLSPLAVLWFDVNLRAPLTGDVLVHYRGVLEQYPLGRDRCGDRSSG